MKTKQEIVSTLNSGTDPKSLGFERHSDDGHGHEYWVRTRGAVTMRLNRTETEDGVVWDDDVDGWENPS
jgi:hypothetical protein